ncbi:FAD/NAD-P-binding domain-containing protein [Trametopsis cervina]|nr:FAD/NAD-P-binding domain-containing protein [Trametopsis cervina]
MTTVPSHNKKLNILIIGGGVCGLTLAVSLAKYGVNAHIYEAAAKFGEIGAGIGIGQNAIRILQTIGVVDSILEKAGESGRSMHRMFRFISGMEGHEVVYAYPDDPEGGNVGVARSSFLDALVELVDPQYTHFNKRCVSVKQPSKEEPRPTAYFADGTSSSADVILLANGIWGAGREAVTGVSPKSHVAFSNAICYRGLVSADAARALGVKSVAVKDTEDGPVCYMGEGKHLIVFPIKGGTILNIVAFVVDRSIEVGSTRLAEGQPTVVPVTKEELLHEYEGWGPDVINLLSCIEQPNKWYINVVYPPLETYVNDRIALLGDAAHGMVPHLGAGAGQGIEDAYLLSKLLSHPQATPDTVEAALRVYDAVRRPRAQRVWEASIRAADIYEGYGEHGASNEARRRDLEGIWDWVWHHGADEDYHLALEMLRSQGLFDSLPQRMSC